MDCRLVILTALCCCVTLLEAQEQSITGKVVDEKGETLSFVNMYLKNSADGASTLSDGTFSFRTKQRGKVELVASMVGYTDFCIENDVAEMKGLLIMLKKDSKLLDEVVIQSGRFILKGVSALEQKGTIDLVTTAGSTGDLFKALSFLPGAQVTGIDGRLLIRGGSSNESQTYIDDMHVLSPYGSSIPNTQARSRYSPFFFTGINFSMGGFSTEYSQSMSSILPLYTRDEEDLTKVGVNLMNVSIGAGGVKAWKKASLSFNVDYGNLGLYNKMFYPSQQHLWVNPVQFISIQKQFRYTLSKDTYLKTYYTFDRTTFKQHHTPPFQQTRLMDFAENNLYLNQTFRTNLPTGLRLFAGVAYAWNQRRIGGAQMADDQLKETDAELHLKVKGSKRFSDFYKLEVGLEGFWNRYGLNYFHEESAHPEVNYQIGGLFLSNDFYVTNKLLLNASLRTEYTTTNHDFSLLPRLAVSYQWEDLTFSAVAGRYQQLSSKTYLIYNPSLTNERNWQFQVGVHYQKEHRIARIELYHKKYDRLTTKESSNFYTSTGQGYSRGVDVFINNQLFLKHWDYIFSYTYNDSQRKYLDYPSKVRPAYSTKHNASLSLRYTNLGIRSIVSLSGRVASGFPYHNPNEESFMSGRTSPYFALDASWTVLAHKSLIIYLGFNNILNNKNIYGYTYSRVPNEQGVFDRQATTLQQPQGLYIGFFLTLGKNVAYETSHF